MKIFSSHFFKLHWTKLLSIPFFILLFGAYAHIFAFVPTGTLDPLCGPLDPSCIISNPANGITSTNISNWDTAYNWGDHSAVGYAKLSSSNSFTTINPITTLSESWIGPSSTDGIYFKGGKVGIGTNDPKNKLSVQGSVMIGTNGAFPMADNLYNLQVGDFGQTSHDGGSFSVLDFTWLSLHPYAIYSLGGIRTDGQIYLDKGDLIVHSGKIGLGT